MSNKKDDIIRTPRVVRVRIVTPIVNPITVQIEIGGEGVTSAEPEKNDRFQIRYVYEGNNRGFCVKDVNWDSTAPLVLTKTYLNPLPHLQELNALAGNEGSETVTVHVRQSDALNCEGTIVFTTDNVPLEP